MYFDPRDELLVMVLSAWPSASDKERFAERQAFFEALRKAVSSAPPGLAGGLRRSFVCFQGFILPWS